MGFIVGIDTGGTFTDVFAARGSEAKWTKVWTTPHDLTVSLMDGIQQISEAWGLSIKEFLSQTDLIKYGTTIGTNTLIQKSGPKLGVIVTRPFERNLYSNEEGLPSRLCDIVQSKMVLGVRGQSGRSDAVKEPLDGEEAHKVAERLVDLGAKALVISLRGAADDPSLEKEMKSIVVKEYPPQYLGRVPHFLSSAVSVVRDDSVRTNTAILNAYLHKDMVRFLYKAEDVLRQQGLKRPLLITHCTGGVAKVARTIAIHTCGSGPTACVYGCARMAKDQYDSKAFISIDIGGTSTDIAVVKDDQVPMESRPVIEGVRVGIPMVTVRSISGGGGSKASVLANDTVKVGPESAAGVPGPAAYDLGGIEPTTCDAQIILGYLDTEYYFGGKKKLNIEKAKQAIMQRICQKTGFSLEQAAMAIVQSQEKESADAMAEEIRKAGLTPNELTLFALGGNGGMHCCALASLVGIPKIVLPRNSAIASAYGAGLLDIVHIRRQASSIPLMLSEPPSASAQKVFNDTVASLMDAVKRDIRGEGFSIENASFLLQAEIDGPAGTAFVDLGFLRLEKDRQRQVFEAYQACCPAQKPLAEIVVSEICLKAVCPIPRHSPHGSPFNGISSKHALKGKRTAWWDSRPVDTDLYERDLLKCGNRIDGPAVVESPDCNALILPGWTFTVDKYLSGVLQKKDS